LLAKSGKLLPNPRTISASIAVDNGLVEKFDTHILPLFGQFIAHDVTSASISAGNKGNASRFFQTNQLTLF
jgi:hypothetical protein